jgi:cell division protein FtsB
VFVAVHFVDLAVFGSRSSREAQLQSDARAEEQAFDALDMTEIKQNLQDCASLHDTNSALVKNIASLEEKFARLEKACQG